MATAGFSAFMQIRAGQAQKAMYNAKSARAITQGRARALEAKQKVLRFCGDLTKHLPQQLLEQLPVAVQLIRYLLQTMQ